MLLLINKMRVRKQSFRNFTTYFLLVGEFQLNQHENIFIILLFKKLGKISIGVVIGNVILVPLL